MRAPRLRSVLYVPGANGRALEKARDLAAAVAAQPDAILVPKVGSAAEVIGIEQAMSALGAEQRIRVWAMLETPSAVLRSAEVAAAGERLTVLVMGTNDLLAELRAADRPGRRSLELSLMMCLLAARAAGRTILDGVYNDVRDAAGFEAECASGRALGFDGKTLIHPGQVEACNRVFSPSEAELGHAQRVISAFQEAVQAGSGVATLDGRLIEQLHVDTALRMLENADSAGA